MLFTRNPEDVPYSPVDSSRFSLCTSDSQLGFIRFTRIVHGKEIFKMEMKSI